MKKLILLLFIGLVMGFCGNSASAQTDKSTKTTQFMQGEGVYESGMMGQMESLRTFMLADEPFVNEASALAAILMIIVFALKSYKMMTGEENLEIMPLLRPFGLAMVIIWWHGFVTMLMVPSHIVESKMQQNYEDEQSYVDQKMLVRADLLITVSDSLYSFHAQTQNAADQAKSTDDSMMGKLSSAVSSAMGTVLNPIIELKDRLEIGFSLLLTKILEWLAQTILRVTVYVIFGIQIIYTAILYILGPFSVAASILPAFRDSFVTWIGRFISVSLYKGVAYLIMYIMAFAQEFAMDQEINKYNSLLKGDHSMQNFAVFAANGMLSFGEVIIAFLMTAICLFSVPSISTWIISTSGITSAVASAGRGAGVVGGVAKKAVGMI